MRNYIFLLAIFAVSICYSQPNTDVFLFDLNTEDGKFEISNMRNISNNKGYDNQPSFLDNNTILYAGTRNGQTDIVKYNISYDSKIFINHTEGSEYSPLKIPNSKAVSAIRLDKDGKQFLYEYSLKNGESKVLVNDIIIGYHVWHNKNVMASSVLEEGGLSLYTTNFKDGSNHKIDANIGRSLHKIPNTELISYVSKVAEPWEIKSFNPKNSKTKSIMTTLPKAEDMCWLPNGAMVMGKDDVLYTFKPNKDVDWNEVVSLETYKITNITRIAVNPNGTKLVVVGESAKETIEPNKPLDHKLENIAWLSGNWKGEAMGGNHRRKLERTSW